MRAVRGRDTSTERSVRRLVHGLGYRYRLHRKDLPGRPDLAFPGRKKAIFVHGCFWHAHGCEKGQPPKSRLDYWLPKLERNRERDAENLDRLASIGWSALTLWQCEIRDIETLAARIGIFLDGFQKSDLYA